MEYVAAGIAAVLLVAVGLVLGVISMAPPLRPWLEQHGEELPYRIAGWVGPVLVLVALCWSAWCRWDWPTVVLAALFLLNKSVAGFLDRVKSIGMGQINLADKKEYQIGGKVTLEENPPAPESASRASTGGS